MEVKIEDPETGLTHKERYDEYGGEYGLIPRIGEWVHIKTCKRIGGKLRNVTFEGRVGSISHLFTNGTRMIIIQLTPKGLERDT